MTGTTGGAPWMALRERLHDRLEMARSVLDEQGYEDVAALVPIEEVLIWMDEIEEEGR